MTPARPTTPVDNAFVDYEAVGMAARLHDEPEAARPTPAPANRHQRRRYAALARAARTR